MKRGELSNGARVMLIPLRLMGILAQGFHKPEHSARNLQTTFSGLLAYRD